MRQDAVKELDPLIEKCGSIEMLEKHLALARAMDDLGLHEVIVTVEKFYKQVGVARAMNDLGLLKQAA